MSRECFLSIVTVHGMVVVAVINGVFNQICLRFCLSQQWMIIDNELKGETATSLTPPALFSLDSLTEIRAQNLFTGQEVPVVISHEEAFDGYLDTVIGELLVSGSNHFYVF